MTSDGEIKNKDTTDFRKKTIIIVAVALVAIATVWIWKSVIISNLQKEALTEKNDLLKNAALEKQVMQESATAQMRQSAKIHLKQVAKPLAWAIRTEWLKNNMGQINLYLNDLVKDKNFQRITITDYNGKMLLSTNKKEEGQTISIEKNGAYLSADSVAVNWINDTLMEMSSPVMGFNNRLGTLVVTYTVAPPFFK